MSGPVVAVVEDFAPLRENILLSLAASGIAAWGAESAEALYRELTVRPTDIVVMDLGLPGESGLDALRHLARRPGLGIIVASARGGDDDIQSALAAGAYRYFVKPVPLTTLLAAIESLWQHLARSAAASKPAPWRLRRATPSLITGEGREIPLTSGEHALLACLATQPGRVVPKHELLAAILPGAQPEHYARIEVLTSRLRGKLKRHGYLLPVRTQFAQGLILANDIVCE